MLCMIDSEHDFKRFYISGAFCGLAYLTKSWHAVTIAFTCFAYLLASGRIRELTVKRVLLLCAAFLAVVLPWAIARFARDGLTLFQQSISVRVAGTITAADATSYNPNIFGYFVYLFKQVHFDGALVIAAFSVLVLYVRHRNSAALDSPPDKRAIIGCIVWIAVTPVLLAFTKKKLDWYVFSSLYGSAVLTGIMAQALFKNHTRLWPRIAAVAAVTALFCYGTITSYIDIRKIENTESYRAVMARSA